MNKENKNNGADWLGFVLNCDIHFPNQEAQKEFMKGIYELGFEKGVRHEREQWIKPKQNTPNQ